MLNYFVLPLLLAIGGLFLLIKLRFFFIIHPVSTSREMGRGLRSPGRRRALMLALAGTLGVGNIFGVAAGIIIGGPGVVFWIALSSIFSMIIKYAETLLAFDMGRRGGMGEVIDRTVGGRAALVYAGLTVALALLMGGAMQSAAFCDLADFNLGIVSPFGGIILLLLVAPCLIFGADKAEKITEIIVPLTTIIYIFMCFSVIFINFARFPEVISQIFSSAFSLKNACLGILPIALTEGFSRGILSNEAGIGSSATAHIRGGESDPHRAGLFGILEVFFDTTLLCTLSGLAILLSITDVSSYTSPMELVNLAFVGSLGNASGHILTFVILSFAYATVICWYLYGTVYVGAYFSRFPFRALFALFLVFPLNNRLLLTLVDLVIFPMTLIILFAIIKGKERIFALSHRSLYKSDS
jgi:AGCS family alanine or glycine:cation symporter